MKGLAKRVVFVDKDPHATYNTIINLGINGLLDRGIVVQGSVMDGFLLDRVFDIVVANPPYLPGVPVDEYDEALLSGPLGYETVVLFIEIASRILANGGRLFLVFSSLSRPSYVMDALRENGFKILRVRKKHFFFEDIIGVEAEKT